MAVAFVTDAVAVKPGGCTDGAAQASVPSAMYIRTRHRIPGTGSYAQHQKMLGRMTPRAFRKPLRIWPRQ